jgi:L-fuculose-phosphate aldolase
MTDAVAIKEKMVVAGKVLVAQGQDDFTRGHISMRTPDDPSLFFMKPHSIGIDELTVDNILTINLDGEVVAGTARRHSEVYIHSEIFRARPDVQAIVHTHPTYSIAFSATGRPLKCYSQPSALFHDSVGVYNDTIALIRTTEMGRRVAEALGQRRVVLLRNHGVVCTGASMEEVVVATIMFENAAMIQLATEAVTLDGPQFPPDDIERLKNEISRPDQFIVNFDYLARRVKRREGGH